MKFGVREICDVVLKAKAAQKVGNKVFYKNEPVCYFDSLKTSSMEGAATTVYAQGGRGNARLVAWEGERTVTFTMEDALISPIGFMILSGAGLIEASEENTIKMHTTEQTDKVVVSEDGNTVTISLSQKPYINEDRKSEEDFIYVMQLKDGEVVSEPYIPAEVTPQEVAESGIVRWNVVLHAEESGDNISMTGGRKNDLSNFRNGDVVLVDYYVEKKSGAFQVDITPDKFGGNYYLEASTLFRDTNGVDMPAEFVIPNCKVQSNFTFTMASSGDPSTFTFTMDAFPDYTRWNKTKKVLAAIQVLDTSSENRDFMRYGTAHNYEPIADQYNTNQKPFIEID
jgi:hypothetical protein